MRSQIRVSEVDPMSAIDPPGFRHFFSRHWADRIGPFRQIRTRIVAAADRASRLLGNDDLLIPIPVRAAVNRRRDRRRTHD